MRIRIRLKKEGRVGEQNPCALLKRIENQKKQDPRRRIQGEDGELPIIFITELQE